MTGITGFALDCCRVVIAAALALIPGLLFWLLVVGIAIGLSRAKTIIKGFERSYRRRLWTER